MGLLRVTTLLTLLWASGLVLVLKVTAPNCSTFAGHVLWKDGEFLVPSKKWAFCCCGTLDDEVVLSG